VIKRLLTKRVKVFPGREGQSLVMMAILIPVLIIFAAFVVDGAHAFVDYRHLQNAADASSLAAAQDINSQSCWPSSPIPPGPQDHCIQDMVTDYAYQNGEWPNDSSAGNGQEIQPCGSTGVQAPNGNGGGDVEACYEWPYNGDNTKVLVMIHDCTGTFLGRFIGVNKICSSVRSVSISNPQVTTSVIAGTTIDPSTLYNTSTGTTVINGTTSTFTNTSSTVMPGTTQAVSTNAQGSTSIFSSTNVSTTGTIGGHPRALFANNSACNTTSGIMMTGNPQSIIDVAQSNGSINFVPDSASNHLQLNFGYLPAPSSCLHDPRSQAGTVTQQPSQQWPEKYTRSAVCGAPGTVVNQAGLYQINTSNPTDGIYCSNTEIDVNASNITGVNNKGANLTLVAPIIKYNGTHYIINGYYANPDGIKLDIWQGTSATDAYDPTKTLTLGSTGGSAANNSSFNDVIWVSNGDLVYNGNSATTGFYEAWNVTVTGNSFNMTGGGPPVGGTPATTTITIPFSTQYTPSTIFSTVLTTVYSSSTGTNTVPDITSSSTSTSAITIPGTTQPQSTTVQTTGTNLALKQ
jgi:hypothetical protein